MAGQTLKFKRGFRPMNVEIEGKDDAVFRFETVALTRSIEREVGETIANVGNFDANTTDEEALDVILGTIDKMVTPKGSKKTKASKVLKDLWKAEEIESMDIVEFLNDLFTKRRPT